MENDKDIYGPYSIGWWFKQTLNDEEYNLAIENTNKKRLDYTYNSFSAALFHAFPWGESPQGFNYWLIVDYKYSK